MRRYGLLLAIALFALVGYSAQAATSAHKTVVCHATGRESRGLTSTSRPPTAPPDRGCVDAPRGLVRQILQHPGLFYVNVHTTTYPDGAISGMLKKATKR